MAQWSAAVPWASAFRQIGLFLGEILSSKREQNSWMTATQKLSQQCASARLWGRGSCVWAGLAAWQVSLGAAWQEASCLPGSLGCWATKLLPAAARPWCRGSCPDHRFFHSAVLPWPVPTRASWVAAAGGLEQAISMQTNSLLLFSQGRWSVLIPSACPGLRQVYLPPLHNIFGRTLSASTNGVPWMNVSLACWNSWQDWLTHKNNS